VLKPALLVVAVVLVLCCGGGTLWVSRYGLPLVEPEFDGKALYIRNDRPQTIRVRIVQPTRTLNEEIQAGKTGAYGPDTACDATVIEATDETGYVLGHLDSGGCTFQTWIIGADGTTHFVPGYADR
jgi:hypothetical protein